MGRRLFMHCNPNSIDWGRFTAFAASYKPNVCSIYEHAGRACELADICPDTLVMARPADSGDWTKITPADWVRWQVGKLAILRPGPNIVIPTPNEPSPDNPAYIAWLCEVIREADRQNAPRLAVLMASVGTPGEAALDGGMYDELIRLLAGSRHFLCLHEYSMASLWWDYVHVNGDIDYFHNFTYTITDKRYIADYRGSVPSWNYPKQYHIGRFMWWNIKANELGVEPPSIWINEFGMDRCGDIENNPRIKDWERDYAPSWPDGAKQFRGAESYQWLWQHHQPDKTFYQFYWEQCAWYLAQLPANVIGVELFMAEESGNWQRNGYNVWGGGWDAFWQLAKDGQEEAVPMAWKHYEVVPHGTAKVNKREQPSLKAKILGQYDKAEYLYAPGGGDIADGWLWSEFSYNADGSDSWFMALSTIDHSIELLSMRDAPQPDPASDTVTLTITLTTAQMATLRDSVDVWRAVWEQIFPQVKGWED